MVSKDHDLSQRRQCALLQLSRTARLPKPKTTTINPKDSHYD
jgi:hypothetical protein